MGLIKTLTIGGVTYDIAADVKLASRGGLSKNADGEIGVYAGSGLYINSGNNLNVLLQDYGGLGVGEQGLYIYNYNIPFDSETIKWEETPHILGQNTRGNAYGVKYDEREFYADYMYGLQLRYHPYEFYLGSYGLHLKNSGGGGITRCETNHFGLAGLISDTYFLDCYVYDSYLYTNLKLGTDQGNDPSSYFPDKTYGITYNDKIVPGFGYNNGLSIYLLSRSGYEQPYLPLGFNSDGAICIHTSSQAAPNGSPTGPHSALQSDGDKVFINLYTLSRQLTDFMEIREGQLICKYDI